jgi:hypothetical protein
MAARHRVLARGPESVDLPLLIPVSPSGGGGGGESLRGRAARATDRGGGGAGAVNLLASCSLDGPTCRSSHVGRVKVTPSRVLAAPQRRMSRPDAVFLCAFIASRRHRLWTINGTGCDVIDLGALPERRWTRAAAASREVATDGRGHLTATQKRAQFCTHNCVRAELGRDGHHQAQQPRQSGRPE